MRPSTPQLTSFLLAAAVALALSVGAAPPAQADASALVAGGGSPHEQYVTMVYGDLFERAPDPAGLQGWTTALDRGTPRVAVANAITGSAEYRSGLIASVYRSYLGRGPDPAGLAHWLRAMGGGATIQQLESGFVLSAEYDNRAGGTSRAWVAELYLDVLGRPAASAEIESWARAIDSGCDRAAVAFGFLLSAENLGNVIDGHYRKLLGRGLDPVGRASWVGAIQGGVRVEAVIGGIIASGEYFAQLGLPPAPTSAPVAGYPTVATTGVPAGTVLRASGSLTITTPGAVIDRLLITGTVSVRADNVTIKNSRIMNTGLIPIRNYGTNLTVMDTEINGQGKGNPAVAYNKYTLLRVNIWNVAEGPRIAGGNVTIQDCYIHHLVQVGTNHTDVIQAVGGSNIVLRHNSLHAYNPKTGAIGNASFQYGEDDSPMRTCRVENNYMNGGNYTVNGGGSGTTGAACSFSNNKFGHDHRYGIKANLGPATAWASTNGYL